MWRKLRGTSPGRAVVVKVDTERFPALASQYNVRSIPNFAVFSRGRLQFQQAGLVDSNTMESWLSQARHESNANKKNPEKEFLCCASPQFYPALK